VEQWFRHKIQKRKRMKTCPQCSTGYPDSHTTCPIHGVLLNEIRDLKPGMVIRQSYRIIRKLGKGGMGTVYLAHHILMDEPRALKFLSGELSRDQAFTARFRREVRTLRQIRNRNVVDCGDLEAAEDGSLFFSMEFVDGPDLRAFLHDSSQYLNTVCHPERSATQSKDLLLNVCHPERSAAEPGSPATGLGRWGGESKDLLLPLGALPVPLALSIARQIAEGLGAAHAKGMVHRDIKPENILMARDGGAWLPKIADFGIVATKESSTAYTRTGGTLLTMAYAAPEQWRGTPAAELDGRTDLYALGGLLYEMLTGQTPFHAENYEGWSRQHQTTPPPPPSALRPELARWHGLDALVLRLLAKDRNDRPKDVAELLVLLDAVRYLHPDVRQDTVAELSSKSGSKPSPTHSLIGSSKWAVAAILIVIALGIWAVVRFTHPPKPASSEGTQTPAQMAAVSTPTANQPSKPSTALLTPAPGGGIKPAVQPGTIPNPTSNAATLLVLCDLACNWTLDGEAKGRIDAGNTATAPLSLGQHVVAAATQDGLDKVENEIEIKIGGQTIVHIALQPVSDARLKAEQEARDKVEQAIRERAGQESWDKFMHEQKAREQSERERVARENAAGVWIDQATGLTWTKKDNGTGVTWQQATDYCRNLKLAGHGDWRLATIDELKGICAGSVGGHNMKGSLQSSGWWYWSSSKGGNASGDFWGFTFDGMCGAIGPFGPSGVGVLRALCVRRP
jgi:serine/threonine protein kinase